MKRITVNGYMYDVPEHLAEQIAELQNTQQLQDKIQHALKLALNGMYGALSNQHFRHYDIRLANSTTGTGRMVVTHIADMAKRLLSQYKPGDKQYTVGHESLRDLRDDTIIAGDTDSVCFDTNVLIKNGKSDFESASIESHFEKLAAERGTFTSNGKQFLKYSTPLYGMCYDDLNDRVTEKEIATIYRAPATKRQFKITTETGKSVIVTEDHSLMILVDGQLVERSPKDVRVGDTVITVSPVR